MIPDAQSIIFTRHRSLAAFARSIGVEDGILYAYFGHRNRVVSTADREKIESGIDAVREKNERFVEEEIKQGHLRRTG
jgi:hypothetical protein